MPTKGPLPSSLDLAPAISWPIGRGQHLGPVVGPGPPAVGATQSTAVVSPALVSPIAPAQRFNLNEMPRHHAVYPNTSAYQVVPGDPNVHPALREDAGKKALAAAARGIERKDRKDKEKGMGDKEGEKKDRRNDRKRREKRKTKPHSEAVEAEHSGPQKSGPKETSEKSSKGKEKEKEVILRMKPGHLEVEPSGKSHRSTSQRQQSHENLLGSEDLAVPTSQPAVQASILPEKPRKHKHHRRRDKKTTPSSTKQAQQPTQQAQQATKQKHTQEPTTPAYEMSRPSPPTSSPASMSKPFPIHILLRRITTSKDLSPREKSSLLTTLHGSLVDLAVQTSLELDLTQHYAKIAAQAAAVQNLAAEIEDPTPNAPVSLENLKASGALGGYLFGTPGLGRERSGSESSSVYSQDGMDQAWEDFMDEESKGEGERTGTGCHNVLSDGMLDAEKSELGVAVRSLKITKNPTSNKPAVYCG
ncbi:hypothetical protein BGX38DRAFT_1165395 [Terfezia claveryi]|nr:hypothetical protein BGX38DRAFT_1165395 [Terfezia claveryi]